MAMATLCEFICEIHNCRPHVNSETSAVASFVVGGFDPFQKYMPSNWIISPGRGEIKQIWRHHLALKIRHIWKHNWHKGEVVFTLIFPQPILVILYLVSPSKNHPVDVCVQGKPSVRKWDSENATKNTAFEVWENQGVAIYLTNKTKVDGNNPMTDPWDWYSICLPAWMEDLYGNWMTNVGIYIPRTSGYAKLSLEVETAEIIAAGCYLRRFPKVSLFHVVKVQLGCRWTNQV